MAVKTKNENKRNVCVYTVSIHMHVHTCGYVNVHACMNVTLCIGMCVCAVYTHTGVCVCVCGPVHMHVCVCWVLEGGCACCGFWLRSGLWDHLAQSLNVPFRVGAHSSMVPGEFHGQRSLEGYSPWGPKESDVTQRLNNGIPTLQKGRLQFILIHLVSSRSYWRTIQFPQDPK